MRDAAALEDGGPDADNVRKEGKNTKLAPGATKTRHDAGVNSYGRGPVHDGNHTPKKQQLRVRNHASTKSRTRATTRTQPAGLQNRGRPKGDKNNQKGRRKYRVKHAGKNEKAEETPASRADKGGRQRTTADRGKSSRSPTEQAPQNGKSKGQRRGGKQASEPGDPRRQDSANRRYDPRRNANTTRRSATNSTKEKEALKEETSHTPRPPGYTHPRH